MSQINTKLDAAQVIKQAYDEPNKRIRVDASVTASIGDVTIRDSDGDELNVNPDGTIDVNIVNPIDINIDAAGGDNIAISDGTNTMSITPEGSAKTIMSNTLITSPFDYVGAGYPSSTVEVYTYKVGGATGSIVGVVTVSYVDATKELILSVAKA